MPLVTNTTGDEWLGVPSLARQLGVTIRALYQILDAGELPAYRIGRVIRIQRVDVEAFRERTRGKRGELSRIRQHVEHSRAGADVLTRQACAEAGLREGGDDWIMAPEAARVLGVQLHTVHHMIDRGELAAEVSHPTDRPRPRRRIRIRRQEVYDCIERSRVKPGDLRHLYPVPADRYG
jgi:excisionase family DNA binding protein